MVCVCVGVCKGSSVRKMGVEDGCAVGRSVGDDESALVGVWERVLVRVMGCVLDVCKQFDTDFAEQRCIRLDTGTNLAGGGPCSRCLSLCPRLFLCASCRR